MRAEILPGAGNAIDFGLGFGSVEVIGYQYTITFDCANGDLPTLGCITDGESEFTSTNDGGGWQCQVTDETDGSFVSGEFTLSVTYPHTREGDLVVYTTDPALHPLSWRATAAEVDAALEEVRDGDGDNDNQVFGAVTVERTVYWPPDQLRWSGQYNWAITFDNRPGDVPQMTSTSTMASNSAVVALLTVGTTRDGNEIDDESGGFGLSFCPNGDPALCDGTADTYFGAFLTEDEFRHRFSEAFFTRGVVGIGAVQGAANVRARYALPTDPTIDVSDWLRLDGNDYTVDGVIEEDATPPDAYTHTIELVGNVAAVLSSDDDDYSATFGTSAVTVTRTGPSQAMGYAWEVTFSNKTVGGNQPDVDSQGAVLSGSGATIAISETQQGNQLTGTFTLSYDGGCSPFPSGSSQLSRSVSQTYPQTYVSQA